MALPFNSRQFREKRRILRFFLVGACVLAGTAGTRAQTVTARYPDVPGNTRLALVPSGTKAGLLAGLMGETSLPPRQWGVRTKTPEKSLLQTLEQATVIRLFDGAVLHLAQVQVTFLLARKEPGRDRY